MSDKQKPYRVGTFYHPDFARDPFAKRTVSAYTLWYDRHWQGCIEIDVLATSGAEAKRKAIDARLAHERWLAEPPA